MPLSMTCSLRWDWIVINILLYTVGSQGADDPCVSSIRIHSYQVRKQLGFGPKWYRFTGTHDGKMMHSCPRGTCGSSGGQIWIQDKIPSTAEGITQVKACINQGAKCCDQESSVQMKNCSDFLVYQLRTPPGQAVFCFGQPKTTSAKPISSKTDPITQGPLLSSGMKLTYALTQSVTSASLTSTALKTSIGLSHTTKSQTRSTGLTPAHVSMSTSTTSHSRPNGAMTSPTSTPDSTSVHMRSTASPTPQSVAQGFRSTQNTKSPPVNSTPYQSGSAGYTNVKTSPVAQTSAATAVMKNNQTFIGTTKRKCPLTTAETVVIFFFLGLVVIALLAGIACQKRIILFIESRKNHRSVDTAARIRFNRSQLRGESNRLPPIPLSTHTVTVPSAEDNSTACQHLPPIDLTPRVNLVMQTNDMQ